MHFEYKKILNGRIEYVSPQERNKNSFEGFIKLSRDPQGCLLRNESVATRGSVLLYAEWAMAVVLYIGHDCQGFSQLNHNSTLSVKPSSYFIAKSQKLFLISTFCFLFFTFLSVVNYSTGACFPDRPEYDQNGISYKDRSTGKIAASYLFDYLLFLPQCFYFIIDA